MPQRRHFLKTAAFGALAAGLGVALPGARAAAAKARAKTGVGPLPNGAARVISTWDFGVLKAGNPDLPYVALLTQSFPQLISVPRDSLLADASEETLPAGVHMRVLLGEQSALLPDLEAIEGMVVERFAVVS